MTPEVLIVDDEENITRALTRLLRLDGYTIHAASNGAQALEILAKSPDIAVIICDQRMPGMTGAQVLAEAYKERPDSVRITLTGFTDLASAQSSINEGRVNHFLLKPWNDDQLRAIVREGVRSHEMTLENRRLDALVHRQKTELENWNHQLEHQVQERTNELKKQNEQLLTLQHRLEKTLRDTVGVLVSFLETSSPALAIHSQRVAGLSRQMAVQLKLDSSEQLKIEFAAQLHEIGKLTLLDREDTHRHPPNSPRPGASLFQYAETGYAILSRIMGFESIALSVKHQHECFNGTGSPDRLQGERIPLGARIIAITNAFDEISHRAATPDKTSLAAARQRLQTNCEKQLDPELVRVFLESLDGAPIADGSATEISPRQISDGMILARDLVSIGGIMLLKAGTALTPEIAARVCAWSDTYQLQNGLFVTRSHANESVLQAETPEPTKHILAAPIAPLVQSAKSESRELPSRQATSKMERSDILAANTHDLSLNKQATVAVRRPQPKASESPPVTEGRILIVDDSVAICNSLRRELVQARFDVMTTQSGESALQLVSTIAFDVVITDLQMPMMSGEQLIARLAQESPQTPCIVITGNAEKEQVCRIAKSPNLAGMLVKPWNHGQLIAGIASAMSGKRLSQRGGTR
jgi:response regulator RpfG family c-di-GMP phosphodiesterase